MLPIAKAGVLLVLLGAGATGTCALAGGFGSGNGEETQKENAAVEMQKPNDGGVASVQGESGTKEGAIPEASNPQGNPNSAGSTVLTNPETNQETGDLARAQEGQEVGGVAEAPASSLETSGESATTDGQKSSAQAGSSSTTITTTPRATQTPNPPSEPAVSITAQPGAGAS